MSQFLNPRQIPLYIALFFIFLLSQCGDGKNVGTRLQERLEGQPITIASFNIAELGNPERKKDFKAIAQIINGLDLIALQEVQDKGGREAVMAIYNELNAIAKTPYHPPLVIPGAGRGFPGNEGYAFLYRDPVVTLPLPAPDIGKPYAFRHNNRNIYGRIPGYAYFKAGTFDFIVATLHLQWEDTVQRKAEMQDIKDWLIEFAHRNNTEERDLIIVGDVNRYGNLLESVLDQHQAPFDLMIDPNHIGKSYRLITLEFLPTLDTRFADRDAQSTTVGASKNLYDQIFISAGAFREHQAPLAQFGETVGVIPFDMNPPWNTLSHETIKSAISDHRPIWAKFHIHLGDDD